MTKGKTLKTGPQSDRYTGQAVVPDELPIPLCNQLQAKAMVKKKHPGLRLKEVLITDMQMDIQEVADILKLSVKNVRELLEGVRPVTQQIAQTLESQGYGRASVWMAMQEEYNESLEQTQKIVKPFDPDTSVEVVEEEVVTESTSDVPDEGYPTFSHLPIIKPETTLTPPIPPDEVRPDSDYVKNTEEPEYYIAHRDEVRKYLTYDERMMFLVYQKYIQFCRKRMGDALPDTIEVHQRVEL